MMPAHFENGECGEGKCNCSWLRDIHCTFFAMRLKIFCICLKTDVLKLSRDVKRLLRIVLRKDSTFNLINVLGPFSVILQPLSFHKVELADTSSADETTKKNH